MLTHRQRQALTELHGRHGRRRSPHFLAEGLRLCREAARQCPDWLELAVLTRPFAATSAGAELAALLTQAGTPLHLVAEAEFATLAATDCPQGALCLLRRPPMDLPTELHDPFALVLDRIREPGNLGTILRTAWAIGLQSVWLTAGTVDPYEAKAVRAGMGAQFALRLVQGGPLASLRQALRERGRDPLYLTTPTASLSCFDAAFDLRQAALVIGNEADGIADLSLGPQVRIPMPGRAESLNAAQAATVLLFDAVRRGLMPGAGGA